jgi:transposase
MHDRYAQYWVFPCTHAVCGAHLLRNLAAVAETCSQEPWAEAMADLLLSAKAATDAERDKSKEAWTAKQRRHIARAFDEIVTQAIRANPDPLLLGRERRTKAKRESFNLALAFNTLKAEVLRFCENLAVPFTNNLGGRISYGEDPPEDLGLLPKLRGRPGVCATWSYVSTARKHGQSPLGVLISMFRGTPWAISDLVPG